MRAGLRVFVFQEGRTAASEGNESREEMREFCWSAYTLCQNMRAYVHARARVNAYIHSTCTRVRVRCNSFQG